MLRHGHQRPRQGAAAPSTCPVAQPLLTGLQLCAARRPGPPARSILDGVYNDIKDDEGFAAECEQGRDLGFDGKTPDPPQPGRAWPTTCSRPNADEIADARDSSPRSRRPRPRASGVVTVERPHDREPPRGHRQEGSRDRGCHRGTDLLTSAEALERPGEQPGHVDGFKGARSLPRSQMTTRETRSSLRATASSSSCSGCRTAAR